MAQATLAFAIKELGRVLSSKRNALWKFSNKLDYLRNVIIVFAISGSRGRIEKIISSSQQFKNLSDGIKYRIPTEKLRGTD